MRRIGLEGLDLVGARHKIEGLDQAGGLEALHRPVARAVGEHTGLDAGGAQLLQRGEAIGKGRHPLRSLHGRLDFRVAAGASHQCGAQEFR
jgi:hypothetical protein